MAEDINISKGDIIWSYVAKFFALATNLIIMPFVLYMLTAEEVGMNYLMATVSSIVMLIDFGFGPQFGRNFSYVNSGAQTLLKEGVQQNVTGSINYHLLAILLKTARLVYQRLSVAALLLMLTGGTFYIYFVTEGFTTVRNSLWIWIIYTISVYYNFYYSYYTTLLTGSGMVAESSKATIIARGVQIAINLSLLFAGWGLFAVVIANLLAPFAQRIYCYNVYFTKDLKSKINVPITQHEIRETFKIIWYNAKKIGVNLVGSYAINKLGIFLVGLYLPLAVVGSYGLLLQLTSILLGVAMIMTNIYMPMLSKYRVTGQVDMLIRVSSFTIITYLFVMIIGGLAIVFLGEPVLAFIKSNTILPSFPLNAVYIFIILLEGNHSIFATFITTKNEVPFVPASLISGTLIGIFTIVVLQFTDLGLWGVVLVQGIIQLAYNNWYWPRWVLRDFDVTIPNFIGAGFAYFKENVLILVRI